MAIHVLKTWPEYFKEIWTGYKTFDIRKNDRNYMEGDVLVLREYDTGSKRYSGRVVVAEVGFVIQGQFGLEADACVMSLMPGVAKFEPDELALGIEDGDENGLREFWLEKIRGHPVIDE